ncbi:MAG: 4-alpha-glucanotransferase [Bacillota bacterium]
MITREVRRLARFYGVETAYRDNDGSWRQASAQSLMAVLKALRVPVEREGDVTGAVRERLVNIWQRPLEPVLVAWNGRPFPAHLRLPGQFIAGPAECRLELENGRALRWAVELGRLPLVRSAGVEGIRYEIRRINLPGPLPPGYHRLFVELPGGEHEILIISSPFHAAGLPRGYGGRVWGVFLPLYALNSANSWGAGNLGDLDALLRWVHGLGGNMAGTLPLLASFLDKPYDPSPYAPITRLFWNEFYIDITRVEEAKYCAEAQKIMASAATMDELSRLRGASMVDYRKGMALRRRVLEVCAGCLFSEKSTRLDRFERWVAENPGVVDYARFRAVAERRGTGWPEWPDRLKNGFLTAGDWDPRAERYHIYVQWLFQEQIREVAAGARERGQRLYLDFPLGVHGGGYDVWRERDSFATGAGSGAPPDPLCREGQDWGFPPLHPEEIRRRGYRYYIECLRNHLKYAGMLRLDHVAGLHRLFWVPKGLPAGEGVYVRYRNDEFYAILCLESSRNNSLIVGEDLGTIPRRVRSGMASHNIFGMYVLPFEYAGDKKELNPVPKTSLSCLNTHDMPTFFSYWRDMVKNHRDSSAIAVDLYNKGCLEVPTNNVRDVLNGCLDYLAGSPSGILLVNLEDLWLEELPQNVPGSPDRDQNWCRKARYSLEEFAGMPEVVETLTRIRDIRLLHE